jgi:hypothetical protein
MNERIEMVESGQAAYLDIGVVSLGFMIGFGFGFDFLRFTSFFPLFARKAMEICF